MCARAIAFEAVGCVLRKGECMYLPLRDDDDDGDDGDDTS